MPGGVNGKILRVDLKDQTSKVESVPENYYRKYLGSRALGAKYYYDEVGAEVDPLGEESKIFIMMGLLNGTGVPAAPKHTWVSTSPLNGFYGEGSTSGGYFGSYLKAHGFDGLIVENRAEEPVYFLIGEDGVEFHSAKSVWGLPVSEAEREIKESNCGSQLALIGPAGENLVRYAAVRVERRTVGRTGLGAVMGSKNLKAVGVQPPAQKSERYMEPAYPEKFAELRKEFYDKIMETEFTSKTRRLYGTHHMFDFINENGAMPTKNFQGSQYQKDTEQFNHKYIRENYLLEDKACELCPIVCEKKVMAEEGKYAGSSSGVEWETIWSFGPQCDNNSFPVVIEANRLCNELGLDTISTGNVVGFVMECSERGLLDDELEYSVQWGDDEAILNLVRDIAFRQDFGDELAKGSREVARKLGVEDIAMQVKGVELPAYDPRSLWGMGLAYATASRGGCHLRSFTPSAELEGLGGGRCSPRGKAEFVVNDQNIRTTYESAGQCFTATAAITPEFFARLLSAVTGFDFTEDELYEIGERGYNIERLLAVRAGIKRKEDTLPDRVFQEDIPAGPTAGNRLKREAFEEMLEEYYGLRGWDEKGCPKEEKLAELKID